MPKPTNQWPAPSMLLVTGTWGPSETFKMIPTTKDCPYVECIYNPGAKILAVIGNTVKDSLHMVPRLDDNGEGLKRKGPTSTDEPLKKQRIKLPTFQEYYIHGEDEVTCFVENFAVNASEFDFKKFVELPSMDDPSKSGILPGPGVGEKSPLILV